MQDEELILEKTKTYLRRIPKVCYSINALQECIEEMEGGQISGVDLTKDRVTSSVQGDPVSKQVIRKEGLEQKLRERRSELMALVYSTTDQIMELPDHRERAVLFNRYVRRMTMEEIEDSWRDDPSMSLSLMTIYRIHRSAVLNFYAQNKENVEEFAKNGDNVSEC